ncbi:MAG: hypothetical protein HKUEN07_22820 [Rhodocyclaceae bacterium]|uniref:Antitoxin n=1 Tax=Candidatus Desulfobacillus denitrificans TaxID=2608985 RepID=A0A809R2A6_9PROT|nr:conserved hypothetical protein [Candidatus Desulfobacillus denitrificans]GIK45115.1 MAG: hypothetical protein BroJett012_10180 [Betaproteobacteria bacterium]GJQ55713.1 MAG: hypothetical protein HKUEN07_22820 [Rhodocyclaceae bacterium]
MEYTRPVIRIDVRRIGMTNFRTIITLEPGKRGGKPTVRGLRIAVQDILGWLASGMTAEEIVADYPELNRDDILACLAYAAEREKHAVWIKAAA